MKRTTFWRGERGIHEYSYYPDHHVPTYWVDCPEYRHLFRVGTDSVTEAVSIARNGIRGLIGISARVTNRVTGKVILVGRRPG